MGINSEKCFRNRRLQDVAWGPRVENGAPGYSGGLAACAVVSYSDLLVARPSRSGLFSFPERDALAILLTHEPWVADPGRGAERLTERLFGRGPAYPASGMSTSQSSTDPTSSVSGAEGAQ